jgi:hypothetical protein
MLANVLRVPEDTKAKVGRREWWRFVALIDKVTPEDVIRVKATIVDGR